MNRSCLKDEPGSPEYAMRRCGPRALTLSSSTFILTMDRAAVVSAATITYPLPVIANDVSMIVVFNEHDHGRVRVASDA